MRVLLIGASGQLGGHLQALLEARSEEILGTYASVGGPGLRHLDLDELRPGVALIREWRPELVILAAGWTWVDGNEDDPTAALRRNCTHPLALAQAAAEIGARFVTYSTDYVFDGRAGPYAEGAPRAPLNAYGRAKAELEVGLDALGSSALCLRTSTVYGPEAQGKNFVYQLVRRLRAGQPFQVPSDQVASPSYGPDVAAVTLELLDKGASGIWHAAGPDALSRADFARAVCAEFELDPEALTCRTTPELAQRAERPLSAALDTSKLRAAGLEVRGVRAGLAATRAALAAPGPFAPL